MQLSSDPAKKEPHALNFYEQLNPMRHTNLNFDKCLTFLPDDAQEGGIKKLYTAKSGKTFSAQSSRTQVSSEALLICVLHLVILDFPTWNWFYSVVA